MQINKQIKKLINLPYLPYLLICLFAYLALAVVVAHAQSVDLGIYPPIYEMQTTPPSNVRVPLTIENFQDSSVTLTILLKVFTAADTEDGQVQFLNDASSLPDPFLLQRIRILDNGNSVNSVTLAAKQKKGLTLLIQIPSNEAKGDYYFSIVFSTANQSINNSNLSQESAGVATNVLLTVGPIGKNQAVIEDFSTPFFIAKGPVPFTVAVRNTSDHFLTPTGDIVIKNMFGQNIGKVDLLPVNILSNSVRKIPDSLQSPSATPPASLESYFLSLTSPAAVWPETFLLGPYTATLTLSLSGRGPVYTRQITFFAFPVEYILGLLAIIAIVAFIIIRVRKGLV